MSAGTNAERRESEALSQPASIVEAAQLRLLDPATLRFTLAGATLRLTIENECSYPSVAVLRAFPLSHPNTYYSVRAGTKEVGVLVRPTDLDHDNHALVEADVQRRYMVSTVHRVLSVDERFGAVDWDVETDRGRCRFTTRDLRENVASNSPGAYLFTDVEGNRFAILDIGALDMRSQALLLRQL